MTVRERWLRKLATLRGDATALAAFLRQHSGLPGPRANLELAHALGDLVAMAEPILSTELLLSWARTPAAEAPANHPDEFVPFCAVIALGERLVTADVGTRASLEKILEAAASDRRWRLREAAAIAAQRAAEREPAWLRAIVAPWAERGTPLLLRAALAALAHPPLLHDATIAELGRDLADRGLACIAAEGGPTAGDEARILAKALAYAPSVFVAAAPIVGFRWLSRWADDRRPWVKKLVVANLRKARLARHHPDECERVAERLHDDPT